MDKEDIFELLITDLPGFYDTQFFQCLHPFLPSSNAALASITSGVRVISLVGHFDYTSVHVAC